MDKKKIEIATNLLEEERLMQVLKASALDCGQHGHKRLHFRSVIPLLHGDEFVFSLFSDKPI